MMDSMLENDPTIPLDFDQSSINYLNHQAKRLNDFSMLDSPIPKQSESHMAKEDTVGGREKMKNGRYSNDQSPERPLSRGVTTMREQESMIGELKKECFGLKLRIYYMEEQLRDTFGASVEDILKENVELKVAVEELKNEISYKTDLLAKASQAMQQMSGESNNQFHNEDDSFDKIKIDYECKLEEKDEQLKKLEDELYHLNEKLAENENKEDKEKKLQKSIDEKDEKYKLIVVKKQQDEDSLKSMICELEQTLATKEGNIEMLRNDLRRLASNNTDRGTQHYKALYERLGKVLSEKENTIVQVKTELTCKSKLVDSLNDHISSLEEGLKDTRDASEEKELELQKLISQLQEQIKKLQVTIQDKGKELQAKDEALTEAKEEKLLVHQQKVQYELDSVKNKDSHIIELEIKVKQQHIDLEKCVDEHNRSMREKDDGVMKLQSVYATAQKEIMRLKVEEKEYKSLTADLKKSLEKSMEKERNICLHLDNLLSKPNEQKEFEKVSSEFIKNLQQQLKEKDVQINEIKAVKDEAVSSASLKQQELLTLVKEKEVIIMDLKKSLSMKEKDIKDMVRKPNATANVTEHNLLSALLKDKNEKDKVIQALNKSVENKDKEISKMAADNDKLLKTDQIVDSLRKQIEELKTSLNQIGSEKVTLESEYKAVNITKESLQKQLDDAHSQLSKMDTDSDIKENTLTSELGELAKVFEGVIETYKLLMEKLNNNQHPDSLLRILQQEITDVEHSRENFQHLLHIILNKFPIGGNDFCLSDIVNKEKTLKVELEESKKRTSSLEDQLYGITVAEHKVCHINSAKYLKENESLKKDLKKYEMNEKKLTEQIEKMKLEYEQLVSEREEEISVLMKNMNQEKQVTELLTQQKDMLSKQLDEKQKKITQDIVTYESTKTKLADKNNDYVKLEVLVQTKENCILELQKEISLLQTENGDLLCKLTNVQSELKISNDNLDTITFDLKNAELNVSSLETQLSTSIETVTGERRTLKKDVKELFEMNVRLRKKVKAYELVITKKDKENGKLKEQLEKAEDTNKKLESLLNNSNEKTALEGEVNHLRNKMKDFELLNEKLTSIQTENIKLQEKIDELSKINKLHEETMSLELKKSKELIDVFTEENVTLKSDLHKTKLDKDKILGKRSKELDERTNEIHMLRNTLEKQLKEMHEKANENNMLEYALQKKSKEMDEQANEITSLRSALQKQSEAVAEKLSETTRLHNELKQKSKEIGEKINDNTRLHDALQKQSKEMDEKASDIASLQNALQKQSKEMDEKVNGNTKLHDALQKQSNELDEKVNDNTMLKTALQEQSKEMDEKTMENKTMQIELQQIRETLKDNKLTDKLTSELIESKSLINSLQSQIAFCSGNHGDVIRLKEEIKHLGDAKMQLKEDNRKLKESAGEMSQKLSITLDDNNIKLEEIKVLKTQMLHLEEKIETFSPLYTSSAHNIALSSDAFTQTRADICISENSDSIILQHIKEMQQLRKQLEDTISNNDSLKNQLEERLNEVEQDASLLQDPHFRITLIRDNDEMRVKLSEADTNQKKLKLQIEKLKEEKENDAETINTQNAQMHELNVIATNLKLEMEVYDRLIQQLGINKKKQFTNEDFGNLTSGNDLDKNLLLALLEEIRDLRDQLQLTIDVNNQLREKLEKELGHPVPVETLKTPRKSHLSPRSLFSGAVLRSVNTNASRDTSIAQNTQSLADYPSLDETPTKDIGIDVTPVVSSWRSCKQAKSNIDGEGEDIVISGKVKDFKSLKQITVMVVDKVSVYLKKLKSHKEKSVNLVTEMAEILKLMKELSKLLSTFSILEGKDELEADSKVNDTSEFEIATKLLKACDTLKATKGNLQLRSSRPPSRNNSPNH